MNKPTKPKDYGRESAPVAQVSSPVLSQKLNDLKLVRENLSSLFHHHCIEKFKS
jgi:hypothetical protein